MYIYSRALEEKSWCNGHVDFNVCLSSLRAKTNAPIFINPHNTLSSRRSQQGS